MSYPPNSYGGGYIEPSSGATFYALAVAPGGCPFPAYESTSVFYDENECVVVSLDDLHDLKPLFSGGGDALACNGFGPTRVDTEICTGTVMSAPDTFIFHGPDATFSLPETCSLFYEEFVPEYNKYRCDGGSVIRTVQGGGGCSWNGTELSCTCIPKYAPEPCESVLGPPPALTEEESSGPSDVPEDIPSNSSSTTSDASNTSTDDTDVSEDFPSNSSSNSSTVCSSNSFRPTAHTAKPALLFATMALGAVVASGFL